MPKLSTTKQWMIDHPDDTPCPRSPNAARSWRRKRGLELTPKHQMLLAKYEEAMAAKRAALAQSQQS